MIQVIKDLEEALKREISKISTQYQARKCDKTLRTTFDTFTGEEVSVPIDASFYDENSGANAVVYPRFDIQFTLIQEDKTSGRMISIWEDYYESYRTLIQPNQDRPQVFEPVVSGREAENDGDGIKIDSIKLSRINESHLVKIMSGNNRGVYKIDSIDYAENKIILENVLVSDIQEISFNENNRKLYLLNPTDLFAVRTGDIFVDSDSNEFKIQNINTKKREVQLGGTDQPTLEVGSSIVRQGNIMRNVDKQPISYIIMDPSKPKVSPLEPNNFLTDSYLTSLPSTPFNYHFDIEVKNKERIAHIETAERMTETFINRPRRAIQVVLRKFDSAESNITCGSKSGNGFQIEVDDASCFCVNDSVYLINRFEVGDNNQIIDIDYNNNVVTLRNRIPTFFSEDNEAKLVSNVDVKFWSLFLNNGNVVISQDSINNFYRQQYSIRIEGWKHEKTGEIESKGITDIKVTLETPNKLVEEL